MCLPAVTFWSRCFFSFAVWSRCFGHLSEQEQDQDQDEPITRVADDTMGWYIDSGVSAHLCHDKTQFKTIEFEGSIGYISMANDKRSEVCGQGSVELNLTSGKTLTLANVYFVPENIINLMSVDVLDKEGFKISIEAGKMILSKGGVFVGKAYSREGLYKLSIKK